MVSFHRKLTEFLLFIYFLYYNIHESYNIHERIKKLRRERIKGGRVSPWGVPSPFDYLRKRGNGFYRFRGFRGGGAAHKNRKAPRSFEDMVFTKDEKPVNLLNLQNLLTYEDSYKGKMVIFCVQTSGLWWRLRRDRWLRSQRFPSIRYLTYDVSRRSG